jgi:hypothetical protein
MFDAKPEDRDQIALWISDIEVDHRPGPEGTLIPDVRITFRKKGSDNYEQIYWKSRLKKDNPMLWDKFGPDLDRWEKDQTLPVDGLPLESWPAITKAQIKACKNLGLRSVEDIATATDSIRQKLGMGASDLIAKAKAFLENKERSANAGKIAKLEEAVAQLQEQLKESTETNKALAAELKARKPSKQERAAA